MWLGHWENLTIDKPGHWFHSWTIPNFPQTLCENPERDRAVSFKTFRAILSDLNQHARVNGDIEKYKAEELYYHFLLHYFPECSQIAVLRRRYSSPNALDSKADLLINAKGSLIWPSSSERQRNNSDESTRTVYRRGGTLEYFMDLSTNPHSGSAMHGSTDDIPSLITSLLTCSDTEEGTKDQKMDFKDNINVQSTEMFNVGASMDDDDPIPTHLKQEFQQYQHSRLKRKSSSDEHPVWPEYYDNPRVSKKRKSDSDDHDAPIKDEPVDEEIVEMFSKMRNRTDVTMDVPSHDEVEYPLVCPSSPLPTQCTCSCRIFIHILPTGRGKI
jgi:hypothetical protein